MAIQNNLGSDQPQKSKIGLAILIMLVFGLAVGAIVFFKNQTREEASPGPKEDRQVITRSGKQYFDPQKTYPPNFPAGLPLERPLDVTDNSQVTITYPSRALVPGAVTTPEARQEGPVVYLESTVEYGTETAITKSAGAYRNYLKDNGWRVTAEDGIETAHTIRATKLDQQFIYTYSQNSFLNKNFIKLIHTYPEVTAEALKLIKQLQASP